MCLIFSCEGDPKDEPDPKPPASQELSRQLAFQVHYHRPDADYQNWQIQVQGSGLVSQNEGAYPLLAPEEGGHWARATLNLADPGLDLSVQVQRAGRLDPLRPIVLQPFKFGEAVYIVQGGHTPFKDADKALAFAAERGHRSDGLDFSLPAVEPASSLPKEGFGGITLYHVFVGGFQDSDGDGIGDFEGLRSRLGLLAALGVKGLLLLPVYPSSDGLFGRAPIAFGEVNPDYGDESQWQSLINEVHRRGMSLFVEYGLHHSSIDFPVFQDALARPDHPLRSLYYWAAPAQTSAHWFDSGGGFYYSLLGPDTAHFNLAHPKLHALHLARLTRWLNQGLDGLWLDGLGQHLPEDSFAETELVERIADRFALYDQRLLLCAPQGPGLKVPEGCGFRLSPGLGALLLQSLQQMQVTPGLFGYLSAAGLAGQIHKINDARMNLGGRITGELDGPYGEAKQALMATLLLTLPGIPVMLYGEEIGLRRVDGPNQRPQLAPMSWDKDAVSGGFSRTGRVFTYPSQDYEIHNVKSYQQRVGSLWHHYKALIQLRATWPALNGTEIAIEQISEAGQKVLAFRLRHDQRHWLVLANLSSQPQVQTIQGDPGASFLDLLQSRPMPAQSDGSLRLELGAYATKVMGVRPH